MRQVLFALPIMLLLPAGAAVAQVGGSYQDSCTGISQNGSVLIARCRGPGGVYDTTIDTDRCGRMGVANDRGRLTCGNQRGTSRPVRGADSGFGRGDDDSFPRRRRFDDGSGYQRRGGYGSDDSYGGRPRYRDPEDNYAPPRRRYFDPDAE